MGAGEWLQVSKLRLTVPGLQADSPLIHFPDIGTPSASAVLAKVCRKS